VSVPRRLLIALLPLAVSAGAADHPPHGTAAAPGGLQAQLAQLAPVARARAEAQIRRARLHPTEAEALHVDAGGDLFYTCSALPAAAPAIDLTEAVVAAATMPLSHAPRLHSRPGCPRVIHLDFTGHVVTGTAWNASAGIARWDAVPYDSDGDPTTFSTSEVTAIRRIWQRVAEDFAPFDVDVSTEEIAEGPQVMRVLITRDTDAANRDCPGKGAGGIAYIGVWGNPQAARYAPAWVYSNRLGGGREDYVAEACSHEAGHNLGLHHDGTATAAYYPGHGDGEVSWAPIMGVAYGANVTQWSQGGYPGANQAEDDVGIIAGHLGWCGDDHAERASSATRLAIDGTGAISATGVIGRRGDGDAFSLVVGDGALDLEVVPYRAPGYYTRGGNADLRLELRDAAGALAATCAPASTTDARLATTLPAGRYTLTVAGDGAAGLYDDYASLGAYTLSGRAVLPIDDGVPPARISDLAAVADGAGALTLRWTAPGDDGTSGSAALYAVRRADSPIVSESAWESAALVPCTIAPGSAGSEQTLRVSGLPALAHRWLAVRAIDEAGNAGPLAVADATTEPPSLTIADGAVTTSDGGGLLATFTVTCSPVSATMVSAAWWTSDNTAHAPGDYTAATGSVVFAAGQTTQALVVAASGGRSNAASLHVHLGTVLNADLADSLAMAELPAGAGNPGARDVIQVSAPMAASAGGGGSGGCGVGSAIAVLAMAGVGLLGRVRGRPRP